VGLAAIVDGLFTVHEQYLNVGGLGNLVGDGKLPHPGSEQTLGTYYRLAAVQCAQLTLDYTHQDQCVAPCRRIRDEEVDPDPRLSLNAVREEAQEGRASTAPEAQSVTPQRYNSLLGAGTTSSSRAAERSAGAGAGRGQVRTRG
jgi:hypothetical protein